MSLNELEAEFDKYYEIASFEIKQTDVPIDTQLILYGLYKQATSDSVNTDYNTNDVYHNIINAFKLNAWLQVKNLTANEAKIAYIEQVKKLL